MSTNALIHILEIEAKKGPQSPSISVSETVKQVQKEEEERQKLEEDKKIVNGDNNVPKQQ